MEERETGEGGQIYGLLGEPLGPLTIGALNGIGRVIFRVNGLPAMDHKNVSIWP